MHTGDLATMDVDGSVNIVGRIKDMIGRGGENIYMREIEEYLYTHPHIVDAHAPPAVAILSGQMGMRSRAAQPSPWGSSYRILELTPRGNGSSLPRRLDC